MLYSYIQEITQEVIVLKWLFSLALVAMLPACAPYTLTGPIVYRSPIPQTLWEAEVARPYPYVPRSYYYRPPVVGLYAGSIYPPCCFRPHEQWERREHWDDDRHHH
jgi:hypothetical protein